MNIGIFTDTYSPQINGVVTSLNTLEKVLTARGHNIYFFVPSSPGYKEKRPNVFRLPSVSFKVSPENRMAIFYPPALLMRMRKFKFDIIHTQSEFPLGIFGKLVSEVYRKPMVHTYHTLWEEYVHYFKDSRILTRKTARRYSRVFCNGVDAVISPTEKTKNILESYGVKKPISVIPTSLDFSAFSDENFPEDAVLKTREELGIELGDPVIVTIGRIAREKSIDKIIAKMPLMLNEKPRLKFVIVGAGPALDELKQQAADLGVSDSVIFTGAKPWETIGLYYRLGGVFVCASTSETQGLTYTEAMASGVIPVVQRDLSVENIISENETGFYFEGEDDLAGAVLRALNLSESERRAVIENARERVSGLSAEHFGAQVEKLYAETIERYKENHRGLKRIKPPFGKRRKERETRF